MSLERASETLDTILRTMLWLIAAAIMGTSAAIMLTMDASSAAQGGRFYVAVLAIVLLGLVDTQLRRLLRRRLPFSLETLPAERRYQLHSLLLLTGASALLLGLALYLGAGVSPAVLQLMAYVLAAVASPFLFAFVLKRYVKRALDAAIDRLFDARDVASSTPRTVTFSFGTRPSMMDPAVERAARPQRVMTPDDAQRHADAWQRIRSRFDADPAQALRDAHELVLELCADTGHPGAFVRDRHVALSEPSAVVPAFVSMSERLHAARAAARATRSALAGEYSRPADLAVALAEYERILADLLAPDGTPPQA